MSHLFTNFMETVEEPTYSKISPMSLFANQQTRSEEPSITVNDSPSSPVVNNIDDNTSVLSLFVAAKPLSEEPANNQSSVSVPELKKEEQVLVNHPNYESLQLEIEKLKQLNLEDRKKLESLELEVENLKNLNRSHVNTINQLSSELNNIRMKDQALIDSQADTINKLSSELNNVVSKNIFEQIESSKDENSSVLSDRIVALQKTIKELEELNNKHVNTIKQLNSQLSKLRSTDSNNEVNLLRKKLEELNIYNQQILVHNNNLARRLMQVQSRY